MLCFGFWHTAKACRDNFHVALVAAFAALYEWPWIVAVTQEVFAAYDAYVVLTLCELHWEVIVIALLHNIVSF